MIYKYPRNRKGRQETKIGNQAKYKRKIKNEKWQKEFSFRTNISEFEAICIPVVVYNLKFCFPPPPPDAYLFLLF